MTQFDRRLLVERVAKLRAEYAAGEQQLAAVEARAVSLRETMLRISGAIQIVEELLATPEEPAG